MFTASSAATETVKYFIVSSLLFCYCRYSVIFFFCLLIQLYFATEMCARFPSLETSAVEINL